MPLTAASAPKKKKQRRQGCDCAATGPHRRTCPLYRPPAPKPTPTDFWAREAARRSAEVQARVNEIGGGDDDDDEEEEASPPASAAPKPKPKRAPSMKTCPACSLKVHNRRTTCPGCGAAFPKKTESHWSGGRWRPAVDVTASAAPPAPPPAAQPATVPPAAPPAAPGSKWTPDEEQQKRKYEASRSEEETTGFKYALHETMDLWYAHQGTTVYMLTELPEGTTREVGYADSGWTTYERRSAEQIKKVYLYAAEWKLVLDLGAEDAEKSRNWPLDPDGFNALIEKKTFTNGADKDAVKELYRKMSINQLGGIEKLDFTGIAEPTVEDMEQLYASCGWKGRLASDGAAFMKKELTVKDAVDIHKKLTTQPYVPPAGEVGLVVGGDVFPSSSGAA